MTGPAGRAGRRIQFRISGTLVTASLDDSAASRDFVTMLPLDLTLEDYAATEKIATLPGVLSKLGAPEGFEPKAGDVACYAPWGNLAIFQKDFRYSSGLVRLGQVDQGFAALLTPGAMPVTIELAE